MSKTPAIKPAQKTTKKVIPINEVVDSLYGSQDKVYPRSVSGFFTQWRWVMIWLTQLFFYGVPWLQWGGRQAWLFDLEAKRFYILNLVLYPQDLIYLTVILIISALSLFLFTAIAGRLWCGYTCPQTVYTEIFLWFEHKIEGDRAARMKLDASALSLKKVWRKTAKHMVWIAFALWTGFTFVGYFTPIRELASAVVNMNIGAWDLFWVLFYGFATYGNAGFMREQVCKHMCPYARFQSVMFDNDTLIVTYDEARGEPRGGRSRKVAINDETKSSAEASPKALGACIDCSLCVQVCPTGIDIRKGLQYECISCGACADVCDTVMDKMGYDRGLIKYSSHNAIEKKWSRQQMLQRIMRPRVIIYAAVLALLIIGLVASLWLRPHFRVDVVRDRGVMARVADDGKLENVYRLKILNGTESDQHYQLSASGLAGLQVEAKDRDDSDDAKTKQSITVKAGESRWLVVDLKLADDAIKSGAHKIEFEVQDRDSQEIVKENSVFLVAR